MAKDLGADYVVNAGEQDPAAEIQKLEGADAAIARRRSEALRAGVRLAGPRRDADDGRHAAGQLRQAADLRDGAQGGSTSTARSSGPTGTSRTCSSCTRSAGPGLHESRPLEEVNEAFDDVEHARNKSPRVILTV
jgi:alcohol dehydrogenase, propanol-preferring